MAPDIFSVPVFFVVFRETIEAGIIVSVMQAVIDRTLGPTSPSPTEEEARKQKSYKYFTYQLWLGVILGLLLCICIGAAIVGAFYALGRDIWGGAEYYYEGAFYLAASLIITVISPALLRVGKMQDKWRVKLAETMREPVVVVAESNADANGNSGDDVHQRTSLESNTSNTPLISASSSRRQKPTLRARLGAFLSRHAILAVSFFTVAREGVEGIVFISGVSFSAPPISVPLPILCGLGAGFLVGWLLYRGASYARLQLFLVLSTCLLYLVAAGIFSRAIGYFEQAAWNSAVGADVLEMGMGAGSYDVDRAVWHVNCCSPEFEGGGWWSIFNGVLGWNNTATYSSVVGYNMYWVFVMGQLGLMRWKEVEGDWGRFLRGRSSGRGQGKTQRNGGCANGAKVHATVGGR